MKGQASLATGLLAPNNWAYEPEVKTYEYDPEKQNSSSMKPDILTLTVMPRNLAFPWFIKLPPRR